MARFKFTFDMQEHIGRIGDRGEYTVELTLLGWRGGKPKYDLRLWSNFDDEQKRTPLKGLALSPEELQALRALLNSLEKSQD